MREYILTEKVKKQLESQGHKLVCHFCGKAIKVGQKVVSFTGYSPVRSIISKRYHKNCYEKTLIKV